MAIARALAMSPDYMLFDEVTSALDPQLVGEVLDTMRLLSKEGMTMIVVTHEMGFAREVSDRVAFFHKGKIHEIGAPEQVIGNPQKPETVDFLKIGSLTVQGSTSRKLIVRSSPTRRAQCVRRKLSTSSAAMRKARSAT